MKISKIEIMQKRPKKKIAKKVLKKKKKPSKYAKCKTCSSFMLQKDLAAHICRPLSEADLPEICEPEVVDAYRSLKKFAVSIGEQRIYTSVKAIMFSRKTCYMFVRPKHAYLEISVFLNRKPKSELIKKIMNPSKSKYCLIVRVEHEDLIEEPLTDWIKEAYFLV